MSDPAPHRSRPFSDRSPQRLGVYRDQWWEGLQALDSWLYRLRIALLPAPWERPGPWSAVALCPVRRYEAPVVGIGGRLHVLGGFTGLDVHALSRNDVFDPAAGSWSRGPDLALPVSHNMPVLDGERLWLVGGFVGDHPGSPTDATLVLDTRTGAWSRGPVLPVATAGGALVRLGRRLHFFGGFLDRDATTGAHWTLELDAPPDRERWRSLAPLPQPRGHLSAAAFGNGEEDGVLYALGGQLRHDTDPRDLDCVHVYSPRDDAWRSAAPLPGPRSHFETATAIVESEGRRCVVIVGGLDRSRRLLRIRGLPAVTLFDPDADRWQELPPLPVGLFGAGAVVLGDRLYVACGADLLRRDGAQRMVLAASLRSLGLTRAEPG